MGGIHAEERAHAVKYELGSVLCRGSTGYSDLGGSNAHTRARASPGGAWLVDGQGEGETRGKMVVYSGDSCQWKIEIDDDSWCVYN